MLLCEPSQLELAGSSDAAGGAFSLYDSAFIGRLITADSRDFYNDNRHACSAFANDWQKITGRRQFRRFLGKVGCKQEPADMAGLKDALASHFALLSDVFVKCVPVHTTPCCGVKPFIHVVSRVAGMLPSERVHQTPSPSDPILSCCSCKRATFWMSPPNLCPGSE